MMYILSHGCNARGSWGTVHVSVAQGLIMMLSGECAVTLYVSQAYMFDLKCLQTMHLSWESAKHSLMHFC